MPSQLVLQEKSGEVEEIEKWLVEYKSIGIASLKKVRAAQLQELKKVSYWPSLHACYEKYANENCHRKPQQRQT